MKFKKLCLILFIMIFCFISKSTVASAKSIYLEKGKTVHYENIRDSDPFYIPSGNCYYNITINNIMIQTEDGIITTEYNEYLVVWDTINDKEYSYKDNKINFKMNGNSYKEDREFYIATNVTAPYTFSLVDCKIFCDITVEAPSLSSMILTKTNITCYLDNIDGKTISIKNNSGTVKWSLSNAKIAKIHREGNSVSIYPKKLGTCYVMAKCNGKTLKCKVRIKGREKLYAGGTLTSYNTRNNTFTMKFKNCSSKKITVLSNNLIAVDSDYSSFDRQLKISKTISIKPG